MNNTTIRLKLQQRLNKLSSSDYDNIECWQTVEAFNKGMVNWCRRNLHGLNVKQTGDEQSKRRIDDFQILLKDETIPMVKKDGFYESVSELPEDYMEWKRLSGKAESDCCKDIPMVIYAAEEGNVDELLRDKNTQPNLKWGETFSTLKGNKIRVYTNNEFDITETLLVYYKQPRRIEILNCVDPYTEALSTVDIECEFKDDIVELFIDEAVKVIAGDLESMNQQGIATGQVEGNN